MTGFKGAYAAADAPKSPAVGRGLTFLGYGLLLMAAPTFGTGAILALILAYARRDGASPLIASHCRFQIRIFWISLALVAASAALGMSALGDAARAPPPSRHIPVSPHAQRLSYTVAGPGERVLAIDDSTEGPGFTYSFGSRTLVWRTRAILEGCASAVLFAFAGLWGVGAPLYGAARLASGRAMGHRPD